LESNEKKSIYVPIQWEIADKDKIYYANNIAELHVDCGYNGFYNYPVIGTRGFLNGNVPYKKRTGSLRTCDDDNILQKNVLQCCCPSIIAH
jgi:hypothetical protein